MNISLFRKSNPHCDITTWAIRMNLFTKGTFSFHQMPVLVSLLPTHACVEIMHWVCRYALGMTAYNNGTLHLCSWVELICDCSAFFQCPVLSSFCLFNKLSFLWKLKKLTFCIPCMISVLPVLEVHIVHNVPLVNLNLYFSAEFLPTPSQIYTLHISPAFYL